MMCVSPTMRQQRSSGQSIPAPLLSPLSRARPSIALRSNILSSGRTKPLKYIFLSAGILLLASVLREPTGRILQFIDKTGVESPIGSSTTMLIGVFSMTSLKASERRQLIRETWIEKGGKSVCTLSEYIRQSEMSPYDSPCRVAYTFIFGAGGTSRPPDHIDDEPLTLESDVNGKASDLNDCTYLNIRENMEHGKSTTFLKWASIISDQYNFDYVAKVDDDTVIWTPRFLEFIEEELPPAPHNQRIYGGQFVDALQGDLSFLYAQGQFYYMSKDLVNYVTHELKPSDRYELTQAIEDFDMGAYITSHPYPIKFIDNAPRMFWFHPAKTEKEFKTFWKQCRWKIPFYRVNISWGHFCTAFSKAGPAFASSTRDVMKNEK